MKQIPVTFFGLYNGKIYEASTEFNKEMTVYTFNFLIKSAIKSLKNKGVETILVVIWDAKGGYIEKIEDFSYDLFQKMEIT